MYLPRAGRLRPKRCLLYSALLVAALPVGSSAARPEAQHSLADKLRRGPGASNHPVHVVPSKEIRIPAGWPLDTDGTITCITCHERLPSLGGGSSAFLRDVGGAAPDPARFCTKCHTPGDRPSAGRMHWMAVRRAHVMPASSASGGQRGPLDAASRSCLTCHDGVTAVESVNPTGGSRRGRSLADRGRNHPVGMAYPSHRSRSRDSAFRPAALLPKEVELPNGRVSCISCHNLYGQDRARLAVPIEQSKLCFTCHQMD
ncbi:MAG TPA: cytochrome c3 family protein [Phycisphaerae bacterium]|nr:cytochrome c3 family protein [Phycisphaerae bacterium]